MHISFPIRKVICFTCFFLLFLVHNSFLYLVFDIEQIFLPAENEDAQYLQTETNGQPEHDEHGSADSEDTFTLEDMIDAQQNIAEDDADSDDADDAPKMYGEDVTSSSRRSDWNLILINKQNPIPDDYDFTLGTIKDGMKCDERILPQLVKMLQAAEETDITLIVRSPYRSYSRQVNLFNQKVKSYMKEKMSYLDAFYASAQEVSIPGYSEHEAGLALDIVSDKYTRLEEEFADTEAGKWLAQNSCKYGFIVRYPKGKEDITGIEYEPWHFRYVGIPAATYMYEHGLTLEEFVQLLQE